MKARWMLAAALALILPVVLAPSCNNNTGVLVQEVLDVPGVVEPHTPGSGLPEEFPTPTAVSTLLGPGADLNRVHTVRTALEKPGAPDPRAILILIPGFLGGATTFDPLAEQLVRRFGGNLEVWAVDRRPNQLEDRLGGLHANAGAQAGGCGLPGGDCSAIFEGAQFYSADVNTPPLEDFPGVGDLDIDLDGVFDPQLPLTDGFGVLRGPQVLGQDDARWLAHWGIDLYMRDWRLLVDQARSIVGPLGLVLMGGHSQGTTWSTTYAAYDLDPDPGVVDAGYESIDGLLLLEGGGVGPGAASKPTLADYQQTVTDLATPGGPDVFLDNFSGIPLVDLGTIGEVASLAAFYQPTEPSLIQRTSTFAGGLTGVLLAAPATNRAVVGMFLDDDFSPIGAFRGSMGFSDNGGNQLTTVPFPGFLPFYGVFPASGGGLRTWKDIDDVLPTCPPGIFDVSPGCAILDNGPPSDPLDPLDPPRTNGVEAEVTPINFFVETQFGKANGFEWYFVDGRVSLDFSYGRDSSALVAEALLVDPADEGPLVVTQNANVDIPVLAVGGSNGLTPEAKSFDRYLDTIATPAADKQVHVLEGYAHLDVTTARDNALVPFTVDWINELLQRKLLGGF